MAFNYVTDITLRMFINRIEVLTCLIKSLMENRGLKYGDRENRLPWKLKTENAYVDKTEKRRLGRDFCGE
jgi:hypothetical protein